VVGADKFYPKFLALKRARHGIEYDPMIYEDSSEIGRALSQALVEVAREAATFLYTYGLDPFLEELPNNADRI